MLYLARGTFRASWSKMTTSESYSKKVKVKAKIPSIKFIVVVLIGSWSLSELAFDDPNI